MKFTALLPIKNKSERIKNKNFKKFFNKPLFLWILEKLETIDKIDQIIINTDAPKKITKFLKKKNFYKVFIKKRPNKLCGHEVSMNKIIRHDIIESKNDNLILTHATNPLLSAEFIEKLINIYIKHSKNKICDSLLTFDKLDGRFYDFKFKPLNHNPNKLVKTQDNKPIYFENSNMYIFSKKSFYKNKMNRIGLKPKRILTPKDLSIDIDNIEDWNLAELIMKGKNKI